MEARQIVCGENGQEGVTEGLSKVEMPAEVGQRILDRDAVAK